MIDDDALAALDRAGVVGMRLNLVGLPIPDFGTRVWRALFARINALGWHVEIHRDAADLHAIAASLLAQSCTLVIDHFGRPSPALGERDPASVICCRLPIPGACGSSCRPRTGTA
ncbi:putative aminohydrolase [Burkholderia cenocepacia]|nr:putative aminohydrolase [Burkholderia cenocepacia]